MISLKNIEKLYYGKNVKTNALNGVSLDIADGEFVAIMGKSGSGKTTLLNIIGGMDRATSGKYLFNSIDITELTQNKLHEFRKSNIAFVFQNYELMSQYTVYENIEMPLLARGMNKKDRKMKVNSVLEKMNISDLSKKFPNELSGGQSQRVAIARAIVYDAKVVLADEPTGSLDEYSSKIVMDELLKINQSGKTLILITHDEDIADYASRTVILCDGRVKSDSVK